MVAIRCSIRLEVPLGQLGSLVVSPEYVRYLVQIANDKMEANKKRTDGFLALLQSKVQLICIPIVFLFIISIDNLILLLCFHIADNDNQFLLISRLFF